MDEFSEILKKHVARGEDTKDAVLGAAFMAVNRDGVIHSGSSGRIDFDLDSKPFATDTFTKVASLTKLITSVCVLQVVEKGLVSLDDDVRELIPEIKKIQVLRGFTDDEKPILEDTDVPITLRMLLTHTVGLGYDNADPDTVRWAKSIGRTEIHLAWTMSSLQTVFKFTPGNGWQYGTAIDWAGLVLEKVTGKLLGSYMDENIFKSLGMKDSGFWPDRLPEAQNRFAPLTARQDKGLIPLPMKPPAGQEFESGGAGLLTTAVDYSTFLRAFLNGQLLSEKTMEEMFRPQLNDTQHAMLMKTIYDPKIHPAFAPEYPVGLEADAGLAGLVSLQDIPGKRRKDTLSWSGAFNSRWWVDRESGIAAVMITSVVPHGDTVPGKMYDELERAVYAKLASS